MKNLKVFDEAGNIRQPSHDIIRDALADLNPGERITHRIGTHFGQCLGMAVSPEGSRMITANSDHTARIWDIASGQCLMVLQGHIDELRRAAFMNDGEHAVTAAADGTLRLWDCATGSCVLILEGHTKRVVAVAVSSDDRYVVSSGDEGTLRVWSLPSGRCERVADGRDSFITKVLVTGDGGMLLTLDSNGNIFRWGFPEIDNPFRINNGHFPHPFKDIALTGDGELAAAAWDGLHCFDIGTGVRKKLFSFEPLRPYKVTATPDGSKFVACCHSRAVLVVNRRTGMVEKEFAGHRDDVTGMALLPDGRILCMTSLDWTCSIWDIARGECLRTLRSAKNLHRLFFPDNGGHFGAFDSGGAAKIWDLANASHQIVTRDVASVATLVRPNLVATGHRNGELRLWDTRDHKDEPRAVIKAHSYPVNCLVPMRAGTSLATCGYDGMKIWDVETRNCVRALSIQGLVTTLAVDEDGERVAVGRFWENDIHIYDLRSGERSAVLKGHAWSGPLEKRVAIRGLHFLTHGKGLVSCSRDGRVILWDPARGEAIRSVGEPGREIMCMAVESDERHVVVGTFQGTVERWDLENGQRSVLQCSEGFPVLSVALSPDEKRLFASFTGGTVRIIDRETAILICVLWNVDEGFLLSIPPDEHTPDGWVWTNRDDLLHVLEESSEGRVLRAVPLDDDRRTTYVHTRNNAAMVQARLKGIHKYARIAGRYASTLDSARTGNGLDHRHAALPAQRKGDKR